jgi:hypothetical protein
MPNSRINVGLARIGIVAANYGMYKEYQEVNERAGRPIFGPICERPRGK